ncbi:MAG: tripartite tricarboxylate transporter TctB family protein [Rhizobiaceae bacterium]
MKRIAIEPVNGFCGALLIGFGVFFLVQALNLSIGTAFRMGPGYFPVVLSATLIFLGFVVLLQATRFEVAPMTSREQTLLLVCTPFVFAILYWLLGAFVALGAVAAVILYAIVRSPRETEGEPFGVFAWRGLLFILPAPVFFGLTVRGLGFVPALFVTALIAAFASHRMRPGLALIVAASLTLFATIVFSYMLGLPFRRFGPWLPFD